MRGKTFDYIFFSEYINDCLNVKITEQKYLLLKLEEEINDIEKQIIELSNLKEKRSKLLQIKEFISKTKKEQHYSKLHSIEEALSILKNKKVNNTKTFKQLLNWNVIKLIDGKVFESDYFIDFNNYIKHAE